MGERSYSRRWVVRDLGRGGLAVAVLGLVGCADGSSAGAGTAGSGSGAPPSGASGTGSASPSAASAPAAGGPDENGPLTWKRANLGFVSAYVLVRGHQAAVVDTGVSGSADAIGQVLDQAGPGWSGVRHVVLTHHHPDHAGSIAEVLGRAAAATGYLGEADLPLVSSPRPLRPLVDGAEVFGLQVVATPGHTAGHMSVFDPDSGVLVVGDALNNSGGLSGSNPSFTDDQAAAEASVKRLSALPVRTVLFGHGEPLTDRAAEALKGLAG